MSVPPLALQRCPEIRCGAPLRATLTVGAPAVLACDRLHLWLCVPSPDPVGWRLIPYRPRAARA